jgi:hypothetical protein
MTSFSETWAASRRLFILRLLIETGGEANESVIALAARQGGFGQTPRDEIAADLDHLHRLGATTEEWIGTMRIARVTERGDDIAHGRVKVAGVEHSLWRRGRPNG